MLERVQKRATKTLSQHRHLSYTGRLKVYKLPKSRGTICYAYWFNVSYNRFTRKRLQTNLFSTFSKRHSLVDKRLYIAKPYLNPY